MRIVLLVLVLSLILCGCTPPDDPLQNSGNTVTTTTVETDTATTTRISVSTTVPIVDQGPMRVVMIGDSNTEYGRITNALNTILEKEYGEYSSGFVTFSTLSAQPKPNNVITNTGDWVSNDITLSGGVEGPFGLNVTSKKAGATLSVEYLESGFSLYYLKQPEGGTLSLTVNGETVATVDTKADSKATGKYTYYGEDDSDFKTLEVTLESGKATLFGVEILIAGETGGVCHNWGNSSADSQHFVNGDAAIFETALTALDPTHVVYLIGTNDKVEHTVFKNALVEQIKRIQQALPQAKILLVSTFDVNVDSVRERMSQYLAHAYPAAAAETGVAYWNMHEFFGSYDSARMQDDWHCNAVGGKAIAEELYRQLANLS